MTTEHIITTAEVILFLGMIVWAFALYVRSNTVEDDVIVRIPDPNPPVPPVPRRITTYTVAEWVDGAYQVVETKITRDLF